MSASITDKLKFSIAKRLLTPQVLAQLEGELFKARGSISRYLLMPGPVIREPEWNFELLKFLTDQSFVMEMITRTITQEVARPGLEIKARFASKCTQCGAEYQAKTDECEECGSTDMRSPQPKERKILEDLLLKPNPDYDWDRMIRSIVEHDIKLANWWLSVTYRYSLDPNTQKIVKTPAEIYIEDPRYVRILADEKGRIRSDQYFCPRCYTKDVHEALKPEEIMSGIMPTCPTCKQPLVMTAYIQQIQGQVVARWGIDEMVHGSSTQSLPELYGRPRPLSVWKWLLVLNAMLNYVTEVYSSGYVDGFLVFQGLEQDQVNSIKAQIEREIETKQVVDAVTGESKPSLRIRQAWIGTGAIGEKPLGADFIPAMPEPSKMQSLDWFKFGIEKVTSVFGVTPVFVSIIESGKTGANPRMQIDVQNRTIQEAQKGIVSALNHQLIPRLGVHDWELTFKEMELRDELREAQIHETNARAAARWLSSGFNVKIDPSTGAIIVSGEGRPFSEAPPEIRGLTPRPEISEASGYVLEKIAGDHILAIGTRGEIEETAPGHMLHPAITIFKGRDALRLDAGAPLHPDKEWQRLSKPILTFLSHAHPDHIAYANSYPGQFFSGPEIVKTIQANLGEEFYKQISGGVKEYEPWRWIQGPGPFRFKLYPTLHSKSKITPSYAIKVDTGDETILYLNDFIGFKGAGRQSEALEGVDIIILDGSNLTRDIVRKDPATGEIYGHTSLEGQIRMAAKAGIKAALISHYGKDSVMNPARLGRFIERMAKEYGIRIWALQDGSEIELHGEIGKDALTTETPGVWSPRADKIPIPQFAMYLVPPHARMIWDGSKTVTVKSRRYESHENEPLLLIEGENAYGTIMLRNPREISWKEFDELQPRHRISRNEAEKWGWTRYEKLWAYDIEILDRFAEPIYIKIPRGVQTFVEVRNLRFYDKLAKIAATIPGTPEHTHADIGRGGVKIERGVARKLRSIIMRYQSKEIRKDEAMQEAKEALLRHRKTLEAIGLRQFIRLTNAKIKALPPEVTKRLDAELDQKLKDFENALDDIREFAES